VTASAGHNEPLRGGKGSRSVIPQARSSDFSGLPNYAFDKRWQWAAMIFLAVTTLLRLAQLRSFELAPDEAYYWEWSRRLSLGYYDQGPFVAYMIRATTMVFGTNEFGVRFGVLAFSVGTLLCGYVLARRLFSPMTGFLFVALLGLSPFMEVGSLIATYDPPLVFFWALSAVWLERALFADKRAEQNRAWTIAGIATGFGFLCKHTMLFLIPCLVLYLAISPRHRVWFRRPQPYLAFVAALLLYSGVFWWNAYHHWWTFRHLLFLVHKNSGSPLSRFGDLIGSQALLVGPFVFFGALIASGKGLFLDDTMAGGQRCRFLACMGLPLLGMFCLMTFKSKVQANWPAGAWVTMTILWAAWLSTMAGRSRRSAVGAFALAGAAGTLGVLLTLVAVLPGLGARMGIRLAPDRDQTNTVIGWRALAAHVDESSNSEPHPKGLFIAGNGYQNCSELAFYMRGRPSTHDLFMHNRLDMYAADVERLRLHLGEDAIFVDDSNVNEADLKRLFEEVVWEPPYNVWRKPEYSVPIRTLYIAHCRRFKRYVGLEWAQGG